MTQTISMTVMRTAPTRQQCPTLVGVPSKPLAHEEIHQSLTLGGHAIRRIRLLATVAPTINIRYSSSGISCAVSFFPSTCRDYVRITPLQP